MISEVTFKDGYKCLLKLIYNWDKCHIYETPQSYLIVPYKDVTYMRVTMEEFVKAAKEAKEAPRVKKELIWNEIKLTSNSGTD
jgi:hypothetical protein